VALVPSVILHEVSHGAVALMFGDDTAKKAGRLTLNPIRHVDPFGTIILPALLVFAGQPAFGWAKPVPVNPRALRNPRQQSLLVSLAGPAVNITIALLAAVVLASTTGVDDARRFVWAAGVVNVILAAFNLIPIPPLDGSAVVERLLPHRWWPSYLRFRQYSMGILLMLVLVVPGALTQVFDPALRLWNGLWT
jgi:Zn-dependent protease